MKRIITVLCVLVALTGIAVVSVQATQEAEAEASAIVCDTRTSTSSSPGSWYFVSGGPWWRIGPLRATPQCGGYIIYASWGWRFDGTQCGQVWVRRPLPGGGTYIVPGTVKHICGGQSTVVMSRCSCQRFWVEAWPYATVDRNSYTWPVAITRF